MKRKLPWWLPFAILSLPKKDDPAAPRPGLTFFWVRRPDGSRIWVGSIAALWRKPESTRTPYVRAWVGGPFTLSIADLHRI